MIGQSSIRNNATPTVPLNKQDVDYMVDRETLVKPKGIQGLPDFDSLLSLSSQLRQDELEKEKQLQGGKELHIGETKTMREFRETLEKVTGKKQEAKNKLGKDDYIRLMVTQLQNQDPTKPMENHEMATQMAQFNTVEQLLNINHTLADLSASQSQMKNERVLDYIGKQVDVAGNALEVKEGALASKATFALEQTCERVSGVIKNTQGEVIKKIALGRLDAGKQTLAWDGTDNEGQKVKDGSYRFSIEASTVDGKEVPVSQTFYRTAVVGVSNLGGAGRLETACGTSILPQDVNAIFAPEDKPKEVAASETKRPSLKEKQAARERSGEGTHNAVQNNSNPKEGKIAFAGESVGEEVAKGFPIENHRSDKSRDGESEQAKDMARRKESVRSERGRENGHSDEPRGSPPVGTVAKEAPIPVVNKQQEEIRVPSAASVSQAQQG